MFTEYPQPLEANSELVLERAETYRRHDYRPSKPELYVGNFSVLVGLSVVANTLTDGGQLAIVEKVV
jgi:hypothetical protein